LEEKKDTFKNKLLRRWLPSLLSLLILGIAIYYLWQSDMFAQIDLSHPDWRWLAALVVLRVLSQGVIGYSEALYVAHLGASLTFVEWFGLSVASSVVNLLTPIAGGAVLRGGYYQLKYDLHLARYTPLLAATALINYLVSGVVGLVLLGLLLALGAGGAIPWAAPAILIALAVVPLAALVIPLERLPIPGKGRIVGWIRLALGGWTEIRTSPSLLLKQCGLIFLLQVLQGVSMIAGVWGLGLDAPPLPLFFVGIVLSAWRVTPAMGVGAKEVIATLAAPLVGLNPSLGLLGALASRLANWLCIFTLGPIFSLILTRRLGQSMGDISRAARADTAIPD
jgi:uncharacterized membrane protein YbhN (UPF0104 family)